MNINALNQFPSLGKLSDDLSLDKNFLGTNVSKTSGTSDFTKMLTDKLDSVSSVENAYNTETTQYLNGERDDIQNIMIDGQKSNLTLSLAVKVRDSLVNAYQEISRMQF